MGTLRGRVARKGIVRVCEWLGCCGFGERFDDVDVIYCFVSFCIRGVNVYPSNGVCCLCNVSG